MEVQAKRRLVELVTEVNRVLGMVGAVLATVRVGLGIRR